MATKTPNISLNKPEYSDHVKIARYNENMDILDRLIKDHEDRITQLESDVDALEKRMDTAETNIKNLQTDVKNIKNDITKIQGDITTINNNIKNLQGETDDLKARVTKVENRCTALENRVSIIESTMVKKIVYHGKEFTPTDNAIELESWANTNYYATYRGMYIVSEVAEDNRHCRHRSVEGKMYALDGEDPESTYGHIDFVGLYLGIGWFWCYDGSLKAMISIPFEMEDSPDAPSPEYKADAVPTYWFNTPENAITFNRYSISNNPEFENRTGKEINFKVDYYYDKLRTNPETNTNSTSNTNVLSDSVSVTSKDELLAKIKIGMGLEPTDPTPDILMYWTNKNGDIIAQDGTVITLTDSEKETVTESGITFGDLS